METTTEPQTELSADPASSPSQTPPSPNSDSRAKLAAANNRVWRLRMQERDESQALGETLGEFYTTQAPTGEGAALRLAQRLRRCGLPPRHAATPTEASPPAGWAKARDRLIDRTGSGFLIALLGPRGTGKTQLAVSLAIASAKVKRVADYVKAMELFLVVRSTYGGEQSEYSELDALAAFIRPDLLIIDEIQERGETLWEDRLLTYIIDKRYDLLRDTIIIGNLQPEIFRESLGPSIADRLTETGGVIRCDWESFRSPDKPSAREQSVLKSLGKGCEM